MLFYSYKFGEDVVQEFCTKHTLDLVARAHQVPDSTTATWLISLPTEFCHFQVVLDGIEFFADQKLVTVFSAPAYCGQFDNNAGMLSIDANLTCRVAVYFTLFVWRCKFLSPICSESQTDEEARAQREQQQKSRIILSPLFLPSFYQYY